MPYKIDMKHMIDYSVCVCVSIYLELCLSLLQHFPEDLSGVFLHLWVLWSSNYEKCFSSLRGSVCMCVGH